MTRVLVLEGTGLVVPEVLIEAVEAVEVGDEPQPWLPAMLHGSSDPASGPRRVLHLRGGIRVEVPAAMHIADDVEVLELPDLLQHIGETCGVVGVAEIDDALALVCDPSLLAGVGAA